MAMLAEQELQELIEDLRSDKLKTRVSMLKVLCSSPSGDSRLIPYVEELLTDKTPCLLSIPYLYGEVRWLAAHTLIAEKKELNLPYSIEIENIPRPLDTDELVNFADKAGIQTPGGVEGVLEMFRKLRDLNELPLCRIRLTTDGEDIYECE